MTSEARDASQDQGQPYKLYVFTRGTKTWRYTDADRLLFVGGNAYAPAPITHTRIQDGGEQNKISITLKMPKTLEVAKNWRPYPPADAVAITIMTQHWGEDDLLVDWVGRVIQPKYDDTTLSLTSEPTSTTAKRGNGGRTFQRSCDLMLYSQGNGKCNVDRAAHAVRAVLADVAGLAVTAPSFASLPAGRFAGGDMEWVRADGLIEHRSIDSHRGSTLVLDYGSDDLKPGLNVTAYPGCSQTWTDCLYYGNTDNYGGELDIPGRNYYDGNMVV
ncbi:DUF2163 domain-containing protein [Luteibacter anthropi]|uniref:phage BR0599 family protein n=1 Tax=Luteibacter anthropi TaxID=564369 RepID=UPI00203307C7|nr:phage BR0599 family protein [Luteibacter anthropi]URX63249.1 DUF2163 domain-containing protein [Luteibacter anthropi]